MASCLRILGFKCLLCGFFLQVAGEEPGSGLENGLAVATTVRGEVTLDLPDGTTRDIELHDVETLTGLEISSGKDDYAFLSLSNECALGIYKNSKVRFESYLQRPFPPDKESLEYEPSDSQLSIQLLEGSLSFSAETLSPLSRILIKLPIGQIEIHKASGRVLYDERGVQISISRGIVTYAYPGLEKEEFINGPHQLRISKQSAGIGRVAETSPEPKPLSQHTERLIQATHRANERVIFKASPEETSIPQPLLVADPEALLKPPPRPYSYLD